VDHSKFKASDTQPDPVKKKEINKRRERKKKSSLKDVTELVKLVFIKSEKILHSFSFFPSLFF
jgi:hypothetical protein